MTDMTLHFLDARGDLTSMRDWLHHLLVQAYSKASTVLSVGPIDVVVQAGSRVIPEKGHLGYAPSASLIYVTVDTTSSALRLNRDHSLERMFVHELHHSARWDGPGYGHTLGEALVSEGLAGQFAQEIFGGTPEPWEQIPKEFTVSCIGAAQAEWDSAQYDHDRWFFGSHDLPKWSGYSLGFNLVQRYLDTNVGSRASGLVSRNASEFRDYLGQAS